MVDLSDSFYATQSHAVEIHFNAQLLDIIRVLPGAIRLQKLAIALLTLVTLSTLTMSVLERLK